MICCKIHLCPCWAENIETLSALLPKWMVWCQHRWLSLKPASEVTCRNTVIKSFQGKERDSRGHFKDIKLFPPVKGRRRIGAEIWIPLREARNHLQWFHSHSGKLHIVICKWNKDYINVSEFESISLEKQFYSIAPQHSAWQLAIISRSRTRELLFELVPIWGHANQILMHPYAH